jgi:peptidoglycan hydrolase CwlO-like protein
VKRYAWLVLSASLLTASQAFPQSCEDQLKQHKAMIDIVKAGRDNAEASLADVFSRWQAATKELETAKQEIERLKGEEKK